MDWLNKIYAWFDFISPVWWIQRLIIAAVIVITISGIIAHFPGMLPGAVATSERNKLSISIWQRWINNLLVPMLALAVIGYLVVLVAAPRRPVTLLLHSRVRSVQQATSDLTKDLPNYKIVDVGCVVDQVLKKIEDQGGRTWFQASSEQRQAVREILLESMKTYNPVFISAQEKDLWNKSLLPSTISSLPKWLVESVEITLTYMLCMQLNVKEVKIAGGPAQPGKNGWPLAAGIMQMSQIANIRCVSPIETNQEGFTVQMILSPEINVKNSEPVLQGYCVVDGKFKEHQQDVEVQLFLAHHNGKPIDAITVKIPYDHIELTRRVIPWDKQIPPTYHLAEDKPAQWQMTNQGSFIIPVRDRRFEAKYEFSLTSNNHKRWANTIQEAQQGSFKNLFQSFQIPIPEMRKTAEKFHIVQTDSPPYIIASEDITATDQVKTYLRDNEIVLPVGKHWQIVEERLGNNTLFSWFLQKRFPGTPPKTYNIAAENLAVASQINYLDQKLQIPIVLAGQHKNYRFVAIDLKAEDVLLSDSDPLAANYDPNALLAFFHTLYWAWKYVTKQIEITDKILPVAEQTNEPPSTLLITQQDWQIFQKEQFHWLYIQVVLIIGIYVLMIAWRLYRSAKVV